MTSACGSGLHGSASVCFSLRLGLNPFMTLRCRRQGRHATPAAGSPAHRNRSNGSASLASSLLTDCSWAALASSVLTDCCSHRTHTGDFPRGSPSTQIWFLDAQKPSPIQSRGLMASALPTPSPTHHEHKDGHTAPGKHQVVANLPKEQAREDPANHPESGGKWVKERPGAGAGRQGRSTHPTYL